MAATVIYIAGVPCSGKTTLFKQLRNKLFQSYECFSYLSLRGIKSDNYIMLGVFDGSMNEGTDKLSMTVISDAIKYIRSLKESEDRYVVFVEGDRLFNYRFLSETDSKLVIIDANPSELLKRHRERGDIQSDMFLKSRRTKIENFIKKYHSVRVWNNTKEESFRILQALEKMAKDYIKIQ